MDKATKWFRSILGLKRRDKPPPTPSSSSKRRWSFVAANGNANDGGGGCDDSADHNNNKQHAIAVAAATAAVAEAAVAAAQAAVAVVRLTGNSGRCPRDPVVHGARQESAAAVKIQSTFRGYLARRALRALKGLVKLQALVRGHIERKRTKEWLRKMQALLQAQARARAGRAQVSEFSRLSSKSSPFHHPGPPTPEKFEYAVLQSSMLKRNGSKLSGTILDHYEQVDEQSWVQRVHSTRIGPTNTRDSYQSAPTPSLCEVQSFNPLKYSNEVEGSSFCTADNSPSFYPASSKGGSSKRSPFTPAKSDGSTSYLSSCSDHPNYMSYTESSKAKARSLSAPKLRPQHDRSSSTKRYYSIHGSGELKPHTLKSDLHSNLASKAYPGSGRLDKLGMPVEYRC